MGYMKYSSVSAPLLSCHGDGEMSSLGSAKETAKVSFFPCETNDSHGQCSVISGCFKQHFASLVLMNVF